MLFKILNWFTFTEEKETEVTVGTADFRQGFLQNKRY